MTQLSAMVNLLMPRSTNAASEPTSEMPDDISFPFDALDEVEYLEDLLKVPANATKRKHMVFIMHIVHVSLHLLLLLTSPLSLSSQSSLHLYFCCKFWPSFQQVAVLASTRGHDTKHLT